jgi:3-deoxy-D-manno-octulosonate 8-phosphate phosphatase (KDO 8-P phosphatase)
VSAVRSRPGRAVAARARKVRLLVMDVDGVLTDGRMILSAGGDELKMFHTHDGIGLALARRAGLKTAMMTGETSPIAKARGEKLGVDRVLLGVRRKGDAVRALLDEFGLAADELAFVGDDLLDVPALQVAGLAVAVADAVADVKAVAHVITRAAGGRGAVRECVDLILRARGDHAAVLGAFIAEHGGRARGPAARRRTAPGARG